MPLRYRLIALVLGLTIVTAGAARAQFTITDLGTLGGASSAANDLNARGDVVGTSKDATANDRAFLWTAGGGITPLVDLAGPSSSANAINSMGLIVGAAATTTPGNPQHAVRWVNGVPLEITGFGGPTSIAHGVNDREEIVGSGDTNPTFGNPHAFLWRSGVLTDLQTLGGSLSVAFAVNDASVAVGAALVTGSADNHAFRRPAAGPMQDLGVLATGTRSVALSVNTAGAIVGSSNLTSGGATDHAFFRAAGSSTLGDLGTLGGASSEARDINDFGTIVGWAEIAGGQRRAFTSTGTGMSDLNALLPGGSGWVLEEARAINDAGQVVGVGQHNGLTRAFLLSPPAPLLAVHDASAIRFAGAQPNPVRERTRFAYTLPEPSPVSLAVFDLSGRRVRQIEAGSQAAGAHVVTWDARDATGARVVPGLYFARLEAGTALTVTRRVTVVH